MLDDNEYIHQLEEENESLRESQIKLLHMVEQKNSTIRILKEETIKLKNEIETLKHPFGEYQGGS